MRTICPNPGKASQNRIAILAPSLNGGGAERAALNLAIGFNERGYCVDLLLVNAVGPYLSFVPGTVRVIDFQASRTLYSLPKITRYLVKEKPIALISQADHTNPVAILAKVFSSSRTRVVATTQNTLSRSTAGAKRLRVRMFSKVARATYRLADALVAVSRGAAADLAKILGVPDARVKVIYNPVITPALFVDAGEEPDHPFFRDSSTPVVLAVGRLTPQKNFALLVRAFAGLIRRRRAKLLILGEGEERNNLAQLIASLGIDAHVSMPGFVKNPFAYMRRASAFVLSSDFEGLGNVLIEAMALGVPVVSTDCESGPREILGGGTFGRLVSVGDAAGLARGMDDAISGLVPVAPSSSLTAYSLPSVLDSYECLARGNCN